MRVSISVASGRKALLALGAAALFSGFPGMALAQDDGSGADVGGQSSTSPSGLALQAEVDRSLSDAAIVAQQSLSDMMASQGAGASTSLTPVNISSLPPELQRPITVAWTGPADSLVQRVAQGIGYSFSETGVAPVVPDMVVVRYNNEPAAIVLQDLGLRVSKVAQVSVDTTARSITYVNNPPQIAPIVPPDVGSGEPLPSPPPAPPHHHHDEASPARNVHRPARTSHHAAPAVPDPTIYGYPKSLFIGGQ